MTDADEREGAGLSSGEIVDFDDELDGDFDSDTDLVLVDDDEEGGEHVNIIQRSSTGEDIPYTIDLATPPLNESEARELTERIRNTTNLLWVLIKRAHAGKAYTALGYSSFEAYAKEEFHISRSYAYKLLNQANVIEAIEAVTPEGTTFTLTSGQAADIKPVLPELLATIEERTSGLAPSEAGSMIEEVMREDMQRRRAEADEERDEEERSYSGDYNPDYIPPDDDDDEEAAAPGSLSPQDDAELAATRSKYERLYNFYTTLRGLTDIGFVDDLVDLVPDGRRADFVQFLGVCVPMLNRFNDEFTAFIKDNPTDDEEELDEDLDEDDLDEE